MKKIEAGSQSTELEIKREHSEVINSLRFPMALGVVFLHASYVNDGIASKVKEGVWNTLKCYDAGIAVLFSIAVPLFFIISGYLFFRSFRSEWSWRGYKEKLHRRIYTLLIPYLIWNFVGVFGRTQNEYRLGHSLNEYFSDYTLWGFLKHFWQSGLYQKEHLNVLNMTFVTDYPANVPLWFVRDLMVMVILTPLFYYLLKKIDCWLPLLLFPLYLLDIRLNVQGFSTVAFFYFSVGAWTSLKDIDFTNQSVKLIRYIAPSNIILFALATYAKTQDLQIGDFWTKLFPDFGGFNISRG